VAAAGAVLAPWAIRNQLLLGRPVLTTTHGGQTLLLALDLLVAADIILTITIDLSFETLGMLGILVVIRTLLHFVLELEVSGRWPWQGSPLASGEQVGRQRPSDSE
jgi:hypothetical protein